MLNNKIYTLLHWYHTWGMTDLSSPHPYVPTSQPLTPLQPSPSLHNHGSKKAQNMPKSAAPLIPPPHTHTAELLKNCTTLDALRRALEAFEGCALKTTATHTVFSDGQPNAPVMVIGEAPGADEDKQGKPFVGLSGQLLDRILQTIGLNRATNLYISNIVPWRPPGNRQPTPQEIAMCLPFIERHIALVNPKILILVGGTPTKALLNNKSGIMKMRGQWTSYQPSEEIPPIPTMPTFHPAFLLRSPGQKALVWQDMLMVQERLRSLASHPVEKDML